jgi:hypothetical protein
MAVRQLTMPLHRTRSRADSTCAATGHYEPAYLGANSSSKAAQTYIEYLQQLVSDGNKAPDYAHVRTPVKKAAW